MDLQQINNQTKAVPVRPRGLRIFLGLFFFVTLMSALLSYGAYVMTSEKKMESTLTQTLGIIFRQEGAAGVKPYINYINELSKHQKEISALQTISTIDQAQVEKDMAAMTPEQSERYIQEKFAAPLYEGGKLAESLKKVDPDKEIAPGDLEMVTLATSNSHELLKKSLYYQAGVIALLLLSIVFLNQGFSRLSTRGILILLASLPGFLLFNYFHILIDRFAPIILSEYAKKPLFENLVREVFTPLMREFGMIYFLPLCIGAGLIVIAIILKIVLRPKPAEVAGQPSF